MSDQTTRSAAKLAALIAIPIALLAGLGTFLLLRDAFTPPPPAAAPTETPAPVPTEPVAMAAPALGEWEEIVCRAVLARLPTEVNGLPQRSVTAGPEQNAAYGEPPVTVACGVPAVEYEPTEELLRLGPVCWQARQLDGGSRWTTLDREVPVQVWVPDAYGSPSQQVVDVSNTVALTVRSGGDPPSGCTR